MPAFRFWFIPSLILSLVVPPVGAAELTLATALHRAETENPRLTAQSFRERAAEALIEQAGVRPTPSLDLSAENFLGTGSTQGVRRLETTAQLSQTIERAGKRDKRLALAGRDRDTAATEFAVLRADVLAAAALAYVETLAAQQRLALAEEPLTLARTILASAEARVQAGAASPADPARARAAVAAAQADLARHQAALTAARTALAATWGGRPTDIDTLPGHLRLPDSLPGEEVFLARLSQHPRLAWQQAVIASHQAALTLEQAHTSPDITASGGLRFLREGSDAAFVAGLSVPLPTRHRNQGNLRAARETLTSAEHTARALASELRAAVTAAWQETQAAHLAAITLRRDALPPTEEAHALTRRAYEAGQVPLLDVLDAQRALLALRRDILEAETAATLALVRLEALTQPTFPLTTSLCSTP